VRVLVALAFLLIASAIVLGIGKQMSRRHRGEIKTAQITKSDAPDRGLGSDRFEGRPDDWARAGAEVARVMKTNPERLSPSAKVAPFDPEGFGRKPDDYLSQIEPARCFQTAKPGPSAFALVAASPLRTRVALGGFRYAMGPDIARRSGDLHDIRGRHVQGKRNR
jgi:hypothetical protein